MQLTTLMLADHAEAVNGKLYVTGGCWDSIVVPRLPAVHPHFTVAASLQVPWQATNQQHALRLDLIDMDGQSMLPEPIQALFEAGRPPGMRAGDQAVIVFAFNFNGFELQAAQTQEFVLDVDGTELGRLGFKVVVAEPATSTGQAGG